MVEQDRFSEIRAIVAHALGLAPADMADDVDLLTTFASSWREVGAAISKIEEKYDVTIPIEELGAAPTIQSIYRAVERQAKRLD
ncbi:MAG: acyl carrier protein [Hyphomonadaceae bacterium]|nr:acyl carrier protein [Hyphomonadaceae bacterium]